MDIVSRTKIYQHTFYLKTNNKKETTGKWRNQRFLFAILKYNLTASLTRVWSPHNSFFKWELTINKKFLRTTVISFSRFYLRFSYINSPEQSLGYLDFFAESKHNRNVTKKRKWKKHNESCNLPKRLHKFCSCLCF